MTSEEILNMPAGRKMDELIVNKVMKWSLDPGLPDESAFYYPPEWNDELNAWPSTRGRQQKGSLDLVPNYSTDIAAAWEVVEKICEKKNQQVYLVTNFSSEFGNEFYAEIFINNGEGIGDSENIVCSATAETTPLAICRTALLAVLEGK
jgi:hypothetical protein